MCNTTKKTRRGASLLSYALIVGLVSVVALVSVQTAGSSTSSLFGDVSDSLTSVTDSTATPEPTATIPPITLTGDGSATPFGYSDANYPETCDGYLNPASGYPVGSSDGLYQLDAGGGVFSATCDMTTDGGGWTLATNCPAPSGTCSVDLRGASDLGPYISGNVLALETRVEVTTPTRVYRQYLQNTGQRSVGIDGHATDHNGNPAYVASCKLSYGDTYAGRDWGLNEDLGNTWVGTHAASHNQGSGNWRYTVMTTCHRSIRADDGSTYTAQANTYFGGSWNSYCGGMYTRVNHVYAAGCAISHGYSVSGPEGVNSAGSYYDYIAGQDRVRFWVR